ncbi:S8 family serine peptidase, partial [Microcystis elabens FACHB-917]|nr:S8 family serine peptidase [Microcystis elabens FACHB-917]
MNIFSPSIKSHLVLSQEIFGNSVSAATNHIVDYITERRLFTAAKRFDALNSGIDCHLGGNEPGCITSSWRAQYDCIINLPSSDCLSLGSQKQLYPEIGDLANSLVTSASYTSSLSSFNGTNLWDTWNLSAQDGNNRDSAIGAYGWSPTIVRFPSISVAGKPDIVSEEDTTNLPYTFKCTASNPTPLSVDLTLSGQASAAVDFSPILSSPFIVTEAQEQLDPPLSKETCPEILVQWELNATEEQRSLALASHEGILQQLIHTAVMQASGDGVMEVIKLLPGTNVDLVLDAYKHTAGVRYAELNRVMQTQAVSNDPYYTNGSQWGAYSNDYPLQVGPAGTTNIYGSQAELAWGKGFTGSNSVVVGILDQGLDYTHPDLAANIWSNPYDPVDGVDNDGNGYIDDIRGWDFLRGDKNVIDPGSDPINHGTHVAGTIGAIGGNGIGVAGINWNVSMIPLKFIGTSGGAISDAIKALDYLTDLKARHNINVVAVNSSWTDTSRLYSQALQDAISRAAVQNILFVASAGNTSSDNDAITHYPSQYDTSSSAGYNSVISVAAINSAGLLASFSSYGSSAVDLAAPGQSIISTTPGNSYGSSSGTSMAAPHVTGAIALYAASNPSASAQQIRSALLGSTTTTTSLTAKTVNGGRLNVDGFISAGQNPIISIKPSAWLAPEGNNQPTPFSFLLTRTGGAGAVTVDWSVAGVGPNGATSDDFLNGVLPTGSVSFEPGEVEKTITVYVQGDMQEELDEDFEISLSPATGNAYLANPAATARILNDDGLIAACNPESITIYSRGASISSVIDVGDWGTSAIKSIEITLYGVCHTYPDDVDILLVGPTGAKSLLMSDAGGSNQLNNVTLTFSSQASTYLSDSSAITSGKYKPTDFQLGDVFASPASSGPYTADLSVFTGTNPSGTWTLYTEDDSPGDSGTIAYGWSLSIQFSPAISVAISSASVAEDGTYNIVYTFSRTGPNSSELTVYYTLSGTATAGVDFSTLPSSGSSAITFAAGASTATLTIDPTADLDAESDETVELTLVSGSGYSIATTDPVVASIINDDLPAISVAISSASFAKDGSASVAEDGTDDLVYTFSRTGPNSSELTVYYTLSGTATAGVDFSTLPSSGSSAITFAAGTSTATLTIDPTADVDAESDETVELTLVSGSGYSIATTDPVVASIINDDLPAISVAISSASVAK